MFRSKALDIIKALNKDEFVKFGKFLNSPFFNSNKNLVKLYRKIKQFYPDLARDKFNKVDIFKSVYDKSEYDDSKIRKLFSELHKELNRFLITINIERETILQNRLLLNELNIKRLDNQFYKKFSEANEYLDNDKMHYNYFLDKFILQWEYVAFHLERGEQLKIAPNIIERSNNLIFFFLSDLFLSLRDIDANWYKFGYKPEINLPKKFLDNFDVGSFLKSIDDNVYPNKVMLNIYYTAYLAFSDFENEAYYSKLEKLVINNWKNLSNKGRKTAIYYLFNYCIFKIGRGHYHFEKNLYEFYKRYLEYKVYEQDAYVRTDIFLSIIDSFYSNGKIDEARIFLENNFKSFHPEHGDNLLHYINALSDFENAKYGDSLNNLARIKTHTFLLKRRIKLFLLKIYYEMDMYDEAKTNAINYKMFLMNNKSVPGQGHEKGLKFIHFYSELLRMKFSKEDSYTIENLISQINVTDVFEEKLWLIQKLEGLSRQSR